MLINSKIRNLQLFKTRKRYSTLYILDIFAAT